MTNIIRLLAAGAATLIASATCALGANFSFTGNFSGDDQVLLFGFTVTAPSTVTLTTLGYGGGTNAAGTVIPAGGFDPLLSLFGPTGMLITFNDDIDTTTGDYDALIQQSLVTGTYTLALTQATSSPVGPDLSDGFQGSGALNFNGLTSAYAVDILNVASASPLQPPPPPGVSDSGSSLALFMLSLGGLVSLRRFVNRA